MKRLYHLLLMFLGISGVLLLGSCVDEESPIDAIPLLGNSNTYVLNQVDGSAVSGTVKFEEARGGYTKITIELSGTPDGAAHPTHIHFNSVAEGGGIAITL